MPSALHSWPVVLEASALINLSVAKAGHIGMSVCVVQVPKKVRTTAPWHCIMIIAHSCLVMLKQWW